MSEITGFPQGIGSMEPLLPDPQNPRLAELSQRIFVDAGALRAALPDDAKRQGVAALLREMNSYYSNLIEGHKTLPRDIESALHGDFLTDEKKRLNQHLATAHILTQEQMEQRLAADPALDIYSPHFLCELHRSFYARLPDEAHAGITVAGRSYPVEAGITRTFDVSVGGHTPPRHDRLDAFLGRFQSVYSGNNILATNRLAVIAAAHHRLAWIHPFGDGNGRVARLHSHAALIRLGVDGAGLWMLSRGLARFRNDYYTRLAAADRQRHNDYDGRGNLSARDLTDFCIFFLETILDQIQYMGELLDLPGLLRRIEDYVHRESGVTRHRQRLARLLTATVSEGSVPRSRVPDIVGLKPSAARQVTRMGLDEGLLQSPTPKGPLRIAFPAKVLDAYFPRLFLDLPYGD